MAGDLIPPPSPAGKPKPEGDAERSAPGEPRKPFADIGADAPRSSVADAVAGREAEPPRALPPLPAKHRGRFAMLGGLVVGVGLAVVAVCVLLLARGDGPKRDGWSAWTPSTSKTYAGAKEVAEHVGVEYRRDDSTQLVQIQSGPLRLDSLKLDVVTRDATTGGDIKAVSGKGVWYVMNGLGPRGSISTGKPSETRSALVQREALELSLYSFRYLDGVDYVVTIMPPQRPGTPLPDKVKGKTVKSSAANTPIRAVMWRKKDLEAMLDQPLKRTLADRPPLPASFPLTEAERLADQIAPHVFSVSLTQAQTGQGYLVLDRG